MGLLSSALRAEVAKQSPSLYSLLDLDLSQGGLYPALPHALMSKPGISSPTRGLYQPRVVRFGRVKRAVSDRDKGPILPEMDVVIDDSDFYFRNALGYGVDLQGSPASILLASGSTSVTAADWLPVFSGILYSWDNSGPMEWTLHFRPDTRPLEKPFPSVRFTKTLWPNLDSSLVNTIAPVLWGKYDAVGTTGTGAARGYLIDNTAGCYAFFVGAGATLRIYKDGVLQTPGTNYTSSGGANAHLTTLSFAGGMRWTVVQFIAPLPSTTSTITADVVGYDTNGDLFGTTLYKPADCILHMLANFVYSSTPWDGSSLSTNDHLALWHNNSVVPYDAALWTAFAAALDNSGGAPFAASRYITAQTTGLAELQAWARTFQADVFWTNAGKLGVALDTAATASPGYISSPWFSYPSQIKSLKPIYPPDGGLVRVEGPYTNGFGNLSVSDPGATFQAGDTLDQGWAPLYG